MFGHYWKRIRVKITLAVAIAGGIVGAIVAVRQVFTCCTDFGALTFVPSLAALAAVILLGVVAWRNT